MNTPSQQKIATRVQPLISKTLVILTLVFISSMETGSTLFGQSPINTGVESSFEPPILTQALARLNGGVATAQPTSQPTGAAKGTYVIKLDSGAKYAGRIEFESKDKLIMTRRNGRIARIDIDEIEDRKKVDDGFSAKTQHQLRVKLQKEFGSKYEVSLTSHFVVVHPPGDYKKWAMPFELLYERFKNYFRSRGLIIDKPEFPMVAIVLRTRKEFERMGEQKGFSGGVVGYYAYDSNRLIAYKQNTKWRNDKEDWVHTMDTMVHEAVHQTACNVGIHSRLFRNPSWVVEGLATVFEAKGINNYFKYSDFNSRINYERLLRLKAYYKQGNMDGAVAQMIASDQVFRSNPDQAYAMAWGLSFYLSQRQPHLYVQYLEKLQQNEQTSSFGSINRVKYFEQTFGPMKRVEGQLKTFVKGLPDEEK